MQLKKREKKIFPFGNQITASILSVSARHQGQAPISQGVKEYTRLPFYMQFQMPHQGLMSFIIILSCNSVAHSICTLLTVFVIYVNHFHQKANKHPLKKRKKKEIENHKVNRQHWPNPKEFITYTIKKQIHQLSFSIY